MNLPRVRLLTPHSPGCCLCESERYKKNPWAFFGSHDYDYWKEHIPRTPHTPSVLYLDALGRKRKGAWRRWLTAGCNDGNCQAVIAVNEADLLTLAQKALSEVRP
jgi:hypothetical protein